MIYQDALLIMRCLDSDTTGLIFSTLLMTMLETEEVNRAHMSHLYSKAYSKMCALDAVDGWSSFSYLGAHE